MPFAFTDYDPYDFANRRHIGPPRPRWTRCWARSAAAASTR